MSKQAEKDRRYAAEGRKLAALLEEKGIGATAFSRMLAEAYKLTAGPQNVQNWKNGRGFNAKNQSLCAALFGLPPNYFEVDGRKQAPPPDVRNPALGKLLQERKLRRPTVDALRALDAHVLVQDEHYWSTQADIHEGIAASQEAARFKPPSHRPRKPSGGSHRA